MNHPIIRPALETDLPRLLEIYNEEVEHSTATFDTKPPSLEDRPAPAVTRKQRSAPGHVTWGASFGSKLTTKTTTH